MRKRWWWWWQNKWIISHDKWEVVWIQAQLQRHDARLGEESLRVNRQAVMLWPSGKIHVLLLGLFGPFLTTYKSFYPFYRTPPGFFIL